MADDSRGLRERLRQVLWLGGSACSGKTMVARRLGALYGLAVYHTDDSFERLRRLADPRRHPAFCRVGDLTLAELLAAPVEAQAADMLAFHREHFALVVAELAAAAPPGLLLVEGSCLLPGAVAEVAADAARGAFWLLATPAFRRRSHARRRARSNAELAACARPDEAFERWMARDDALADWRRRELTARGLAWRDVDGRVPPARQVAAVAAHLGLGDRTGDGAHA